MRPNSLLLSLILSILIAPSFAWSAKITKVKGNNVLINTEADPIKKGALYYLVRGGKKKAIIKVLKTRPGKAIGKVLKGKAMPGYTLVRRPSKKKKRSNVARKTKRKESLPPLKTVSQKKSSSSASSNDSSFMGSLKSRLGVGGVLSLGQDSSSVKFDAGTSSASGSSTSFELIADYKYTDKITIRGSLGQQAFSTEDNNPPGGFAGGSAIIDLSYINLDVWGKYHFTPRYWAGGGVGILLSPSAGSTNAVLESDLGSQMFIQVGGGVDYQINDKFYIPAWIEYGTTIASGDATLSAISLKFGLAMKL